MYCADRMKLFHTSHGMLKMLLVLLEHFSQSTRYSNPDLKLTVGVLAEEADVRAGQRFLAALQEALHLGRARCHVVLDGGAGHRDQQGQSHQGEHGQRKKEEKLVRCFGRARLKVGEFSAVGGPKTE